MRRSGTTAPLRRGTPVLRSTRQGTHTGRDEWAGETGMDAAKTADMEDGEQITQRVVHMPPVRGIRTPNISGPSTGESERRSVVSDGRRESHRILGTESTQRVGLGLHALVTELPVPGRLASSHDHP